MGTTSTLTASDGHGFNAYWADPKGTPKGGLVIIQEIFGLNSHIREVADGYAADGYKVVAPAMFDRVKPGIELGYDADDVAAGRDIRAKISWDDALKDVAAAIAALKGVGRIGVVGYCWGGSLAWLTATRLTADAAVCFYGGQVPDFAAEKPRCPTMLHFGEKDAGIPLDGVEKVRASHPDMPLYIYAGAGHGFSCDHRGSFHPESHKLARQRTLDFLGKHIG